MTSPLPDSAPLSCRQIPAQAVGVLGVLFSVVLVFGLLHETRPVPGLLLAFPVGMAVMSLYVFLFSGRIQVDEKGITQICPLGTFFLAWEDFEATSDIAGTLVFAGANRRLVLPASEFWWGRHRWKIVAAILRVLNAKGPPARARFRDAIPIPKNTRVAKNAGEEASA